MTNNQIRQSIQAIKAETGPLEKFTWRLSLIAHNIQTLVSLALTTAGLAILAWTAYTIINLNK